MKNHLLLVFGILFSQFNVFSQENKEIELTKKTVTNTTSYSNGTSKTSTSVYYYWKNIGEENWNYVGRKYENISPLLNKYKESAALLAESRKIRVFGAVAGYSAIGAGIITAFTGFLGSKEVKTVSPTTGEITTTFKSRKALGFTGLGIALAGFYTNYFTGKLSLKKFESSCKEYNNQVKKETGMIKGIQFGLTGTEMSYYPAFSFRISL